MRKPENLRPSKGFAEIAFMTMRITASLECSLIVTIYTNGAPLQNITLYLEQFSNK